MAYFYSPQLGKAPWPDQDQPPWTPWELLALFTATIILGMVFWLWIDFFSR